MAVVTASADCVIEYTVLLDIVEFGLRSAWINFVLFDNELLSPPLVLCVRLLIVFPLIWLFEPSLANIGVKYT